jgi:diguanylate cyclase (GGDEF)-like protein/PAS domain S-box-containing protein
MDDSGEVKSTPTIKTEPLIRSTRSKEHSENKKQEADNIPVVESPKPLSLRESEIRYRRLFEAAQDGILILDAKTGMITDVNPYLIYMLGYSREEMVTKKLWEVGAFKDFDANVDAFRALQKTEYIRYKNLPLRAKDGKLIQVEFVSNVYLVGSDKVIQCNIRNITEQKRAQDALLKSEASLRELSMRDHLTGLFNRRYLEENLKREIMRTKRKNSTLGVIMIDIDKFKHTNDTFGHAAGDYILQEVGSLLLGTIREEDILSRYGGDEFVIVFPEIPQGIAIERAEFMRNQVLQHKFHFRRKKILGITLSLGVAIFPKNGKTIEALLQSADRALYQAKHEGRNRVLLADSTKSENIKD